MKKKFIVHHLANNPLTQSMPISATQLDAIAARTKRELEEKIQRDADSAIPTSNEEEVIYKWQ